MQYYKVAMTNGTLDIDYSNLAEGITLSETEAVVAMRGNPEPREGWVAITEEEFVQYRPGKTEESEPEPEEVLPSAEELLTKISDQNIIIMEALATMMQDDAPPDLQAALRAEGREVGRRGVL